AYFTDAVIYFKVLAIGKFCEFSQWLRVQLCCYYVSVVIALIRVAYRYAAAFGGAHAKRKYPDILFAELLGQLFYLVTKIFAVTYQYQHAGLLLCRRAVP